MRCRFHFDAVYVNIVGLLTVISEMLRVTGWYLYECSVIAYN